MEDQYHKRKPTEDFSDLSYMQRTRGKLAGKLADVLPEPEKSIFNGVNSVVVFLDRTVDVGELPDSTFENVLRFLKGEDVEFESKERFERFLRVINKLSSEELKKRIYQLLKEEYYYQVRNVARRFRILDAGEILELREEEHPIFTIDMLVSFPEVSPEVLEQISRKYTLAAKIADDMMDFPDDVRNGFLYVPKQHIDKVKGIKVTNSTYEVIGKPELDKDYIAKELKHAEEIFAEGDKIASRYKFPDHFQFFRGMMYSWIEEAHKTLQI